MGGFEAAVLLLVFDSVEALDPVEVGLRLSSGGGCCGPAVKTLSPATDKIVGVLFP